MITIGLIEDDPVLRLSFETFFKMDKELKILFSLPSIEHFLSQKAGEGEEPFILFLDIGLPGISGLEGISIINQYFKNTHLVILSANNNEETIWEAISKGANGYLLKPVSFAGLKKQIEVVKNGGALISPEVAHKLINHVNIIAKPQKNYIVASLTTRENQVINQMLKGFTYKEIAMALSISVSTVNDHLKNIYVKLGVNSKAELISKLLKNRGNNKPIIPDSG